MVQSQCLRNHVDRFLCPVLIHGTGEKPLQIVNGEHALHDGGIRCDHHIILILTHRIGAFRFKNADYGQWNRPETNHAPNGILAIGKQIVNHRFSEDTHLGRRFYIVLIKNRPILHLQFADIKIFRCHAIDRRGIVVVAVHKLSPGIDRWRYRRKLGNGF